MRFAIVYLLAAVGLQAQALLSGEVALAKFKQKLAALARASQPVSFSVAVPARVCSISLLRVPFDHKIDPQMVIRPKGNEHFPMAELIPPAPSCDDRSYDGNVSLKK